MITEDSKIMKKLKDIAQEALQETTMSRVASHFNNTDKAVLIITAFRHDFKYKENVARNKQLASKIKSNDFGYVYVDGHWIEKAHPDKPGKEDSILVSDEGSDNLKRLGIKWMKQYEQDSILFKPVGTTKAELIYDNGKIKNIGSISIQDFAKIKTKLDKSNTRGSGYTKLKNRGERTFVFEGLRVEANWISRLSKDYEW